MTEIRKHYTRQELLEKLGEAGANSFDESQPRIGFPRKPRNLPRKLSKQWDEVAGKLHRKRILWTWSKDAELILDYCTAETVEEKQEILHPFVCREPGATPGPQIANQEAAAKYWSHFSIDDLKRLYLTEEEAGALHTWLQAPPEPAVDGLPLSGVELPVKTDTDTTWTPGIPPVPTDQPPIVRALWKIAAVTVLFDGCPDGELQQALREPGGQNFFVDRMIESLPYLQKGLKPRV